ncbi:MAG: helix-turn-helix domain-containing protein [Saprospiraceae bacterium]|jgi:excisionase family DNA binding protein|nr:helix-turn-helix domain-containing protein [Saprospiraceae bacterium]
MSSKINVQRICQNCEKEFTAHTTVTRFCSNRCSSAGHKHKIKALKIEHSNKQTQQIKAQPIEELKAKAFLSIAETCKLIGISRRTVYRLIERGELITGKAGKRTIIRRSDLERLLFKDSEVVIPQSEKQPEQVQFDISEYYNLTEIKAKYGIAEATIQHLIKRNNIPKIKKGWFAYVPKAVIDKLLS